MRMCRQHILAPALLPDSSQPVVLCQSLEQLQLFGTSMRRTGMPKAKASSITQKRNRQTADSSRVEMVETKGIEPSTSRMRTERSPS